MKRKTYLGNILTSLSQSVNTIFGGHPDESLSARAYKNQHVYGWNIIKIIADRIFFFEKNHCKNSYLADLERANYILQNNHEQRIDNH
jgi:hypothetical protein